MFNHHDKTEDRTLAGILPMSQHHCLSMNVKLRISCLIIFQSFLKDDFMVWYSYCILLLITSTFTVEVIIRLGFKNMGVPPGSL